MGADIFHFAASQMPEDETSVAGGAVDTINEVLAGQLSANSVLAFTAGAGDTRSATASGLDQTNERISESVTLNGATEVLGSSTFNFIEKATTSSISATSIITIKQGSGGPTIDTIATNRKGILSLFIKAFSSSTVSKTYATKTFLYNKGDVSLTQATVELLTDPSAVMRQGIATQLGDTQTISNRLTLPSGITFVDDGVKQNVANSQNHSPATAQGIWHELSLASGAARLKSSITTRENGVE